MIKQTRITREAKTISVPTRITTPKEFLFIDTETYIKNKTKDKITFPLRLGIAHYVKLDSQLNKQTTEEYLFRTKQEFIDILLKHINKRSRLNIIGHNIGFDIRVLNLPRLFAKIKWSSQPPIINDKLFIWEVFTPNGSLVFYDTANYSVISVEQLGKDFGYLKLEIDFNKSSEQELIVYCRRDVEICERFIIELIQFIHNENLGGFQLSLASQALHSWRYRFMTIQPQLHNHLDAINLERESYHGGRVECFKLGSYTDDTYYNLDINSMYPFIMREYPVPYILLGYTKPANLSILKLQMKLHYCIAKVKISINEAVVPLVYQNRLMFPTGEFITTLHQSELEYILTHGKILEVYEIASYKSAKLFTEFIEYFYAIKQQATLDGNLSKRYFSKILQNSLYGKFGQLKVNRTLLDKTTKSLFARSIHFNMETRENWQEISWEGKVYSEQKYGESDYSFPAIAGAITANARILLHSFLSRGGIHNIFYIDTDSIICNGDAFSKLLTSLDQSQLGYLKLENSSQNITINGNKDYTFGTSIVLKGIPKKAKKINDKQWEYLQFQGFLAWINSNCLGNPTAERIVKERKTPYQKGHRNPDNTISPFIFSCHNDVMEVLNPNDY